MSKSKVESYEPAPRSWTQTRIGDVLSLINGFAFKPSHWKKEGLPIIRIQNLNNKEADYNYCTDSIPEKFRVKHGDLLFAWSGTPGTSFGAHIWKGDAAWLNQHIFRIDFSEDLFDRRFLQLAINANLADYIASAHGGAGLAHITIGKFRDSVLLLAPLNEQVRIVAEIEKQLTRLDAAVAALKRVQANLKRYRAAVLKAACEGRLVPTEAELARKEGRSYETGEQLLARILKERRAKWESDQLAKMHASCSPPKNHGWKKTYKEPAPPDTTNLPDLPTGWVWAAWQQLSERVTVGHVGPMKNEYVESGIPFLRSQNVRANRFDPEGLLYIGTQFHRKLSKSVLQPGDVVVVRSGTVGTACVLPDHLGEANCADLVLIQRPIGVDAEYGAYYMNSTASSLIAQGKVGVALTHFNTRSVAELPVPLPPTAEQSRIMREVSKRLSLTEEMEHQFAIDLARASRLRQSILKRAFEGKLVPQNPNDEPASMLLERIRDERATKDQPLNRARRAGKTRVAAMEAS